MKYNNRKDHAMNIKTIFRLLFVTFFLTGDVNAQIGTYPFMPMEGQRISRSSSLMIQQLAPPEVALKIEKGQVNYIIGNARVLCSMGDVAGCAKIKLFMRQGVEFSPIFGLRKIVLDVGLAEINVIVSSDYPKGTCKFDLVLKHELTHVALARKVVERYAPEIAKAVLVKAESLPLPIDGNGLKVLENTANEYFEKMRIEQKRQDGLLDARGNNVYQWEQCKGKD